MKTLTEEILDVISKSEVVTIATAGPDGPHLVATWGDFIAQLDTGDGKTLLIPAGGYKTTETNLGKDNRVALIAGSKQVPGKSGSGGGFRLTGTGRIESNGKWKDMVAEKFPWARAAFVIEVEGAEQLL